MLLEHKYTSKDGFIAFIAFPLLTSSFLLVLYFMQHTRLFIQSTANVWKKFFFIYECMGVLEAIVNLDVCKVCERNIFLPSSQFTLYLIIWKVVVLELLFGFHTHSLTNTFFFSFKQHIKNKIKYRNFYTVVFQPKTFLKESQISSYMCELKRELIYNSHTFK